MRVVGKSTLLAKLRDAYAGVFASRVFADQVGDLRTSPSQLLLWRSDDLGRSWSLGASVDVASACTAGASASSARQ